jgi:hypothetical protein
MSRPDYVLISKNGFILTSAGNPSIKIKTTSNDAINCEYKLNGQGFTKFETNYLKVRDAQIPISSTSDVFIKCKNKVGNEGLTKKYRYIVNTSTNLLISDIKFINSNKEEFKNYSDIFYLPKNTNLNLNFKLNMKPKKCEYELTESGNSIKGFINFLTSLFFKSGEILNKNELNEYNEKGIKLTADSYRFILTCDGEVKSFNIDTTNANYTPNIDFTTSNNFSN